MTPRLNALIIGCGNIAGGFDHDAPPGSWPLTHAGAMSRHGGFHLSACVEPDTRKRAAFAERWNVAQAWPSLAEAGSKADRFDVISVCSPTAAHAQDLEAAMALAPRLVFCEKPLTPDLERSRALVRAFSEAGIALAVNHTRRWAPDVLRLRDELAAGHWGEVRSVSATYNKGVLNNGGHLIDLLHLLLGPLDVVWAGPPRHDFWPDDPSIAAVLLTRGGAVIQLATAHAADYALFELQLVTSRGVVVMESGGLGWRMREAADSAQFSGYRALGEAQARPGEYRQAMLAAATNVYEHLTRGQPLASTGASALQAQEVCEKIRQKSQELFS